MERVIIMVASILTACFLLGLVAIAAAIGDAKACGAAIDIMGKNPKKRTVCFGPMLISVGLIESIPMIGVVIAIVLLFANPFF